MTISPQVTIAGRRLHLIASCFIFFPALKVGAFLHVRTTCTRNRAAIHRRDAAAAEDDDDLTKEELASRFVDVREHYRQTNEISQDDLCLNMLRTRLPDLHLNRCFVAPSTVANAGCGLFASRKIKDTEMITLYPGDALLQWKNGVVGDFNADVGVLFGNHITNPDAIQATSNQARSYEIKMLQYEGHSLVADPNLVDDAAYLGHLINDGSTLTNKSNKSRTEYSRDTFDQHNAAFQLIEGCHYVAIATKDVAKGEEIFVSYGEDYWLSRSV